MKKYVYAVCAVVAISLLLLFPLLFQRAAVSSDHPDLPLKVKKKSDKGIYITWYVARTPKMLDHLLAQAKACGLNTIVVDAKFALTPPLLELLKKRGLTEKTVATADPWLSELTAKLHEQGFIV